MKNKNRSIVWIYSTTIIFKEYKLPSETAVSSMMYDFKLTQQMKGAQKEKGIPVHLKKSWRKGKLKRKYKNDLSFFNYFHY